MHRVALCSSLLHTSPPNFVERWTRLSAVWLWRCWCCSIHVSLGPGRDISINTPTKHLKTLPAFLPPLHPVCISWPCHPMSSSSSRGETQLRSLGKQQEQAGTRHRLWVQPPESYPVGTATKPYICPDGDWANVFPQEAATAELSPARQRWRRYSGPNYEARDATDWQACPLGSICNCGACIHFYNLLCVLSSSWLCHMLTCVLVTECGMPSGAQWGCWR